MNSKYITLFSILAIVLGAVMVNELVLKSTSADQNRQVASSAQRFEPEQIKWEQELAKTISADSQAKTVLGSKPSSQDRMLFETFEGRYQAQINLGKINKITLLPNQDPIELKTDRFIQQYATSLKDFSTYEVKSAVGGLDAVDLKDKAGAIIGHVVINRDDKGRVLSIEVQ